MKPQFLSLFFLFSCIASVVVAAPSAPTRLSASSITANSFALKWSASTGGKGAKTYQVFRDGRQIGTTTSTSFGVTGLAANTGYRMTVKAKDSSGTSSSSSALAVRTLALEKPPVITVQPAPLTWTFPDDEYAFDLYVVATGTNLRYQWYRNGQKIVDAPANGSVFSDECITGTYKVVVSNSAGSVTSADAVVARDSTAPTTPSNLFCYFHTDTTISLSWTASSDKVGVVGYLLYRDETQIANCLTTEFVDTGLNPNATYRYTVVAYDASENISDESEPCDVTCDATPDTIAPSKPQDPRAVSNSSTSIHLRWIASTDNVGVTGYAIYDDAGTLIDTTTATSYTVTGLSPSTRYRYHICAFDGSGNLGVTVFVQATTLMANGLPDRTPPSVPTGLRVAAIIPGVSITITWTPSVDNTKISHYVWTRNGGIVDVPDGASFTDPAPSWSKSGTTYVYRVRAVDISDNLSDYSEPLSVTIP